MIASVDTLGHHMRVLFADDDFGTLVLGRRMLEAAGHHVDTAPDGEEALLSFRRNAPDIVLLDLGMPRMDGIEVCRAIKAESAGRFVPVIFVTSAADEDLARCLEAGGDGFLSKPLNPLTLNAQLQAFRRIRDLHSTIQEQSRSLREHQNRLLLERQLAAAVFERVLPPDQRCTSNLRYVVVPASRFAGDLILVAERPCGGRHILIADFTGHGLPAAIGTIPVSDMFHAATTAGTDIQSLLRELNQRIASMLPPGMFLAALALHQDANGRILRVWNGGMPDALLVRPGRGIVHRFHSRQPPLGVLGRADFDMTAERLDAEVGDRLYLMSDGLTEGGGAPEATFGEPRLIAHLSAHGGSDDCFDQLESALRDFHATRAAQDDLALVEVTCNPAPAALRVPPVHHRILLHLDAPALREGLALQQILHSIGNEVGYAPIAADAAAILCELFTNSLEHGLLRLDSAMKRDAHTFEQYCHESEQRTRRLEEGWIRVEFELRNGGAEGQLVLRVSDSGAGFDFEGALGCEPQLHQLSGRGLLVVRELARTLNYDEHTNTIEAVLAWTLSEVAA